MGWKGSTGLKIYYLWLWSWLVPNSAIYYLRELTLSFLLWTHPTFLSHSHRLLKADRCFLLSHFLLPPLRHFNWLTQSTILLHLLRCQRCYLSILFPLHQLPSCPVPVLATVYLSHSAFILSTHMLLYLSCHPSPKIPWILLTGELSLSPNPRTQPRLRNLKSPIFTIWVVG